MMPLRILFPPFFPRQPLTSCLPALNRYLLFDREMDDNYWVWPVHVFQVRMYRQRAWGFFDDHRLYSNIASHFPSLYQNFKIISSEVEFSIRLECKFGNDVSAEYDNRQERERHRRRSQHWQDYWARGGTDEAFLDDEVS
ncbi:hypothetical protein EDB82DRAFT_248622 [Fusarium venenatum]|uniref:uncharacterized protein n=1 Tax=Fusarium venenatum TaxID=56646 RepID=UPI001D7DCC70|nr:hypothetical protein EDB82DRAFT_248622 [Fusarium venenatum]